MNPEPPADQVVERIYPLFPKEVREEDRPYLGGENPEGIDWFASSEELKKAPPPPPIPFEMLISKKEPGCEGDPLCLKSDDIYVEIEREVAQQWPQSNSRGKPISVWGPSRFWILAISGYSPNGVEGAFSEVRIQHPA